MSLTMRLRRSLQSLAMTIGNVIGCKLIFVLSSICESVYLEGRQVK